MCHSVPANSKILGNCDTPAVEPASAVAVLSCRVRRAYGAAACFGRARTEPLAPGRVHGRGLRGAGHVVRAGLASGAARVVGVQSAAVRRGSPGRRQGPALRSRAVRSGRPREQPTRDARRPREPVARLEEVRRVQEAVRRGREAAAGPAPAPLPHLRRDADAQELRAPGAARGPRRDVPATVERGREAQAEAAQGPKAAGVGREDAHRRGHGPGARRRRASPPPPA